MVGVYLVKPFLIASIAASLIKSGVSKSGSPAAKFIMSLPSDFNFFVFIGNWAKPKNKRVKIQGEKNNADFFD